MKRCGLYSETAAQIVTGCFERNSSKFVISFFFFLFFYLKNMILQKFVELGG